MTGFSHSLPTRVSRSFAVKSPVQRQKSGTCYTFSALTRQLFWRFLESAEKGNVRCVWFPPSHCSLFDNGSSRIKQYFRSSEPPLLFYLLWRRLLWCEINNQIHATYCNHSLLDFFRYNKAANGVSSCIFRQLRPQLLEGMECTACTDGVPMQKLDVLCCEKRYILTCSAADVITASN